MIRILEASVEPSRAEVLVSRGILVVASVFFALAAAWEMFGPILAGHYASMASMGIIADNMHTWGIHTPVWSYTVTPPAPSEVYCHHPWGIFWTTWAMSEVFGRHDVVCRLPAILLSAATPPLLYCIGRDLYRPIAGAAAAVAFVVLPISLSFAAFNALEVPVMAYGALFLWGWIRFRASRRRLHRAAMLGGALGAVLSDWPGFVLVACVLAVELAVFARSPRAFGRERVLAWIGLASIALLVGGFHLLTFRALGNLDDLFGSYTMRSQGRAVPLDRKLAARAFWIDLSFTPAAIALGKVAAVLIPVRVVLLRRAAELAPLAVLLMALLQYLLFPQGADVHVFWPHYFAMFFALGVATLTATIAPPIAALARGRLRNASFAVAFGVLAIPLALVLRDGVEVLSWARATGGRFSEKGALIETDGDKIAALKELASELPADATVGLHDSMKPGWAHAWALGGRVTERVILDPSSRELPTDCVVADIRQLPEGVTRRLLRDHDVVALGPFLVVRPGSGFGAKGLLAREPTTSEWLLESAHEPVWTLRDDPFLAWEIAEHYDARAEPVLVAPASLEHLRVAYDMALSSGGDTEALFAKLVASFDTSAAVRFSGGLELIGVRVEDGVQPRATLLLRADGPLAPGVFPKVRSRVVERAALSTLPADPVHRDVAPKPLVLPTLWKKGWVYSLSMALLPRPGVEVFELRFSGASPPIATDGRATIELFRY